MWSIGTLSYTPRGLVTLFSWLLWGDFAWNMKERAVNPIAQLMLRNMTAPDWVVGLLLGSIPSAIGFFLGPYISVKSDRHRGRWGRRIPFIIISAPVIALMMVGLALSPDIGAWLFAQFKGTTSLAVCRVGAFAFFWIGFEIATIIANSLVGALYNDVVPHVLIGRFFGLFRVIGLAAGILFNYYLMGKADAYYRILLISVAALYGGSFVVMCLKVREGKYPPPPPRDQAHGRLSPLIDYFKVCFSQPYYLWFFAAITLGNLALAPVNTFSVFHAHSVGMSDDTYGKCLALSFGCSLLLSYPLGILADRIHPLRVALLTMLMYAVTTAFGFVYALTSASFFVALLLHTVISGCYITGTASITQRVLPKERFAEFSSAANIVSAASLLVLPPALGFFVQWMNHTYRYVFLFASVLAVFSAACYAVLLTYRAANRLDRTAT